MKNSFLIDVVYKQYQITVGYRDGLMSIAIGDDQKQRFLEQHEFNEGIDIALGLMQQIFQERFNVQQEKIDFQNMLPVGDRNN